MMACCSFLCLAAMPVAVEAAGVWAAEQAEAGSDTQPADAT